MQSETPESISNTNQISPVFVAECIKQLTRMGISPDVAHMAVALAISTSTPENQVMEKALRWIMDEQEGGNVEAPRNSASNEFLDQRTLPNAVPPPLNTRPMKSILKSSGSSESIVIDDTSKHPKRDWLKGALKKVKQSFSPVFTMNTEIIEKKTAHNINQTDFKPAHSVELINSDNIFTMFSSDESNPKSKDPPKDNSVNLPNSNEMRRGPSNASSLNSLNRKVVKFTFPCNENRQPSVSKGQEIDISGGDKISLNQKRAPGLVSNDYTTYGNISSVDSLDEDGTIPIQPLHFNSVNLEAFYLDWCKATKSNSILKLIYEIRAYSPNDPTFKINLSGSTIDRNNFIPFIRILQLEIRLTELCLNETKLNDDLLKQILLSLNGTRLLTLGLADNPDINAGGIKQLCAFLRNNSQLTSLNLSGINLDKKAVTHLSNALGYSTKEVINQISLKTLNLENCSLKPSSLSILALGIQCSELERVSLRDNKKIGEDGSIIVDILTENRERDNHYGIKYLDLQGCQIGNEVKEFIGTICDNSSLEYLNLRGNDLDSDALVSISDALTVNTHLKCADLSENPLCLKEMAGMIALKEMLLINRSLKQLMLNNVDLSCQAAIALAEVLPLNTTLRVLHVSYNPLDVGGILALSTAMNMNTTLTDLSVLPIIDVNRSFIESEIVSQMMDNISIYLQRNKEIIHKTESLAPAESKIGRFLNDIDSAFAVSQVLNDIITPAHVIPRSNSLEDMVDQLYGQCVEYSQTIEKLDDTTRRDTRIKTLSQRLRNTMALYEMRKRPSIKPKRSSSNNSLGFNTSDQHQDTAVSNNDLNPHVVLSSKLDVSVLNGLFRSDSQFSMESVEAILSEIKAFDEKEIDDQVDLPVDVETEMREIDDFLKNASINDL